MTFYDLKPQAVSIPATGNGLFQGFAESFGPRLYAHRAARADGNQWRDTVQAFPEHQGGFSRAQMFELGRDPKFRSVAVEMLTGRMRPRQLTGSSQPPAYPRASGFSPSRMAINADYQTLPPLNQNFLARVVAVNPWRGRMSKRLLGALTLALMIAAPAAGAAGLWPLSYTQRHDANGKPYPGAKAYFYDATTGDPIAVYREYSLATPHTNPVEADGTGVFPGVYVDGAEDFYRFRVTTAAGVVISDDAVIPNIGPSEGEGGEPPEPVETTALAKTGDIKARYGSGTHVGWLPCNGLTMGSALSGANFATADNQALFLFLWQADETLVVVGGRGANAAADWAANKRLTLPDMRGRVMAGLDTMGNSAASVLPGLTDLGEFAGNKENTLTVGQLPAHAHGVTDPGHLHVEQFAFIGLNPGSGFAQGGTVYTQFPAGQTGSSVTGITIKNTGGDAPFSIVQPVIGLTFYIKL